jgi:hypothetical protein
VIRAALAALAFAFTLAHLPYLASSLEDIDSVNFALGIRDFDVASHRPHPPGYPVYIALGKAGVAMARSLSGGMAESRIEARTLSVLSLIGATVTIFLVYRVFVCVSQPRSLGQPHTSEQLAGTPWRDFDPAAVAATALTAACPLFWYLSVRPMSDVPGLAAACGAQAVLTLAWWRQQAANGDRRLTPDRMAASGRMIVLGSLLAGLAIGFRSQNAVLTLPLLVGVLLDRIGRGVAGAMIGSAVALGVGVVSWAVALVAASGGLDAYLAALGSQAGEDFAGVEMLYLNPTPRLAAHALMRTFVYPWDSVALGGVITSLAVVGILALLLRDRRSFVAISLLAVPYLLFHLLFQDTSYVRYALPLVPPVVFLAVRGLQLAVRQAAFPAVGALALWSVSLAAPVLAAYGSEPSPTVRALEAMHAARGDEAGALAFHQTFQRPLQAENVPVERLLSSPPRREWLELVKYWREGHVKPLWFLADPRRTDLALFDPVSRANSLEFVWRFSSLSNVGGMRPAAATWYRMRAPGWFAEEGWALTPETAGIARLMGRGPALGPITAWVRRRPEAARMMIGGRHLGSASDPVAAFTVSIDNREVGRWESAPGFFLREMELLPGALLGDGPLAQLTVQSAGANGGRVSTAIEQFDLQSRGSLMWAFDEGWHEAEYDPALGMWRWTSERATLRMIDATSDVAITLRAERPRRYFDDDPIVRMTAGDRVLGETRFSETELWSVTVPLDTLKSAGGRVSIETNLTFTPADRGGPPDQRHLGLRIFGVNIAPQP